jgi:putative SOS response-associated peptidase YedK
MCNLYSHTKGQQAIRELTKAMIDRTGNLPPMPGIFPDYSAPIVRNSPDGRELILARWGMPSSKKALLDAASARADKLRAKGKAVDFNQLLRMEPDSGTTNVRNVKSAHWNAGSVSKAGA